MQVTTLTYRASVLLTIFGAVGLVAAVSTSITGVQERGDVAVSLAGASDVVQERSVDAFTPEGIDWLTERNPPQGSLALTSAHRRDDISTVLTRDHLYDPGNERELLARKGPPVPTSSPTWSKPERTRRSISQLDHGLEILPRDDLEARGRDQEPLYRNNKYVPPKKASTRGPDKPGKPWRRSTVQLDDNSNLLPREDLDARGGGDEPHNRLYHAKDKPSLTGPLRRSVSYLDDGSDILPRYVFVPTKGESEQRHNMHQSKSTQQPKTNPKRGRRSVSELDEGSGVLPRDHLNTRAHDNQLSDGLYQRKLLEWANGSPKTSGRRSMSPDGFGVLPRDDLDARGSSANPGYAPVISTKHPPKNPYSRGRRSTSQADDHENVVARDEDIELKRRDLKSFRPPVVPLPGRLRDSRRSADGVENGPALAARDEDAELTRREHPSDKPLVPNTGRLRPGRRSSDGDDTEVLPRQTHANRGAGTTPAHHVQQQTAKLTSRPVIHMRRSVSQSDDDTGILPREDLAARGREHEPLNRNSNPPPARKPPGKGPTGPPKARKRGQPPTHASSKPNPAGPAKPSRRGQRKPKEGSQGNPAGHHRRSHDFHLLGPDNEKRDRGQLTRTGSSQDQPASPYRRGHDSNSPGLDNEKRADMEGRSITAAEQQD